MDGKKASSVIPDTKGYDSDFPSSAYGSRSTNDSSQTLDLIAAEYTSDTLPQIVDNDEDTQTGNRQSLEQLGTQIPKGPCFTVEDCRVVQFGEKCKTFNITNIYSCQCQSNIQDTDVTRLEAQGRHSQTTDTGLTEQNNYDKDTDGTGLEAQGRHGQTTDTGLTAQSNYDKDTDGTGLEAQGRHSQTTDTGLTEQSNYNKVNVTMVTGQGNHDQTELSGQGSKDHLNSICLACQGNTPIHSDPARVTSHDPGLTGLIWEIKQNLQTLLGGWKNDTKSTDLTEMVENGVETFAMKRMIVRIRSFGKRMLAVLVCAMLVALGATVLTMTLPSISEKNTRSSDVHPRSILSHLQNSSVPRTEALNRNQSAEPKVVDERNDNRSIIDSEGRQLFPGDIVEIVYPCWTWSVYVGDGRIVHCRKNNRLVVNEELDLMHWFGKSTFRIWGNHNEYSPEERVSRALAWVGRVFNQSDRPADFPVWVYAQVGVTRVRYATSDELATAALLTSREADEKKPKQGAGASKQEDGGHSILDNRGEVLAPGDIVEIVSPEKTYAVFIGNGEVVRYSLYKRLVVMEEMMFMKWFGKCNVTSFGMCREYNLSEIVRRAKSMIGQRVIQGSEPGSGSRADLSVWTYTGLGARQAYQKGFRVRC